MSDKSYLDWPFFDETHRALAATLEDWAYAEPRQTRPRRRRGRRLQSPGRRAWGKAAGCATRYRAPSAARGRSWNPVALCLIRETLARHSALADFAFAMQGLGSGAISLHGTEELKQRYLPPVAAASG